MKNNLEAINRMLNSINEDNVASELELADRLQAELASETLERNKKDILSEGWDFNTDDDWELVADNTGTIAIPFNILDISSYDGRYFARDNRLYDKRNKTFNFDIGQEVKVRVLWDLDFNDLTRPMAYYISIVAMREFQMTIIGDETIDTKHAALEGKARTILAQSEDLTGKNNMLLDNSMSQSILMARM